MTRRRLVGFAAAGTGALVATSFDMADPAGAVTPLPWFDVRDYGALPDDAGDDTSAINAAISAATAATSGGIVLLPPGTFNISGPITIDATKKALLVGAGMWRTRFLCTSPTAGLRFGATPGGTSGAPTGRSGGFHIDGNGLTTGSPVLMNVGVASNHTFFDIMITNSPTAGVGLLVEDTQNSLFSNLHILTCKTGLALDYGAAGNSFSMFTLRANGTNLRFQNSWNGTGTPPEFNGRPSNNKFFGGTIEGGSGEATTIQVDHGAGFNNAFIATGISGNGPKIKYYHQDASISDARKKSYQLNLINCILVDNVGIQHTALFSTIFLSGCAFTHSTASFTPLVLGDGCYVDDDGSTYDTAGRFGHANSGTDVATEEQLVGHETFHSYQVTTLAASNVALRTVVNAGGFSSRAGTPSFQLKTSGDMSWGSGSASPDVTLRRPAAGQLRADGKLLASGGLGVGNSSAASGSVGPLAKKIQVFDENGNSLGYIPVYSSIT